MKKAKYLNDVLSTMEAESLVKSLSLMNIESYCDKKTIELYSAYEKLNMQSHKNSLLGSDDYILNTFILEEKIKEVIQNLFVIEFFRLRVFPNIKNELADSKYSVKAYICLHFESILVNLLEKFFYFVTACQEADNYLLDIVEYCYYNISVNLSSEVLLEKLVVDEVLSIEKTKTVNYLEDLTNKKNDIDWNLSIKYFLMNNPYFSRFTLIYLFIKIFY